VRAQVEKQSAELERAAARLTALTEHVRTLQADHEALAAQYQEQSRCFAGHFAVMDAIRVSPGFKSRARGLR